MRDGFARFMDDAKADSRIVGVVLGGSRGKGLGTRRSDWDVYVIVGDAVHLDDVQRSLSNRDPRVELCAVIPFKDFAGYADIGAPEEWNRYNFAHIRPMLDRTGGRLQELCDDKEWLPDAVARERATLMLDAYVNSLYRSCKNGRDGNLPAARLDAAESVGHLLDFVFTAERRARPYNKYLEWELAAHPLVGAWWPVLEPARTPIDIIAGSNRRQHAALFGAVEMQARSMGYSEVLDGWDGRSLELLRLTSPASGW